MASVGAPTKPGLSAVSLVRARARAVGAVNITSSFPGHYSCVRRTGGLRTTYVRVSAGATNNRKLRYCRGSAPYFQLVHRVTGPAPVDALSWCTSSPLQRRIDEARKR